MTNQQGAPEALRPITRYEVVDCIDSKHVPAVIPNRAGPWVRYEDHVAALVEAQQPAPSAAAEWLEHAFREGWSACRDAEFVGEEAEDWAFGNSQANGRMIGIQQAAPQPSPTPQADSAPHPIDLAIAADLERSDWTPEEALRWYAAGKHYDTVPNGDGSSSARILDNGAVASNALKSLSREYAQHKGDVALTAPQADSQPAPQGETNAQLDTDSNSPTPGQQRDVAGPVAVGQPVGHGSDSTAGDPSAQRNKLLTVAERNIRSFLRSAVFKSESDREAALNCVDVLWEAARAPAGSEVTRLRAALVYTAYALHATPQYMLAEGITLIDGDTVRVSRDGWTVEASINPARAAPPAQAADSVLEDAARWFAERDNVLQSFWVLLGEAEAQADNDNNPLLKHQVEGFYRQWNAINGTTLAPRWVTRAARKQGANHD